MAQEIINIGAAANDGTGDPLRTAFDKVNNNFTQLYNTLSASGPDGSIQFKNTNTLYSTLYAEGSYVVAGAPGRIYYSNDGVVWLPATTGTDAAIYSLAFDGIGTIIAVGAGGTILRSTNGGVTWTSSTSGVSENLYGAVGFEGSLAVVGANGTILTSHVGGEGYTTVPTVTIAAPANSGGITATATATIANGRVTGFTITEPGLAYNTAPVVTIAAPGSVGTTATAIATVGGGIVTAIELTSGINWSEPTTGVTNTLTGITHGNLNISSVATPIYVATGVTGTIVTSRDLVTWSSVATGTAQDLYSAVIDPSISKLIVVGDNGTVLTSFNASLWTTQTSNVSTTLTSIAFGTVNTITNLIAVGNVGTVIRSNNGGVNWYSTASGLTDNALLGVTFVPNTANVSGSSFLAVGSNATVIESNVLTLANNWSLQSVGSALQGDANLVYFPGTQTILANANVVPGISNTFSLGAPNATFAELYLAGNSLHLGNVRLSEVSNIVTFANSSNTAQLANIVANTVTSNTVLVQNAAVNFTLTANVGNFNTVQASNANISNISLSGNVSIDIFTANRGNIANLTSANANITSLTGGNANLSGNITANYYFGNGAFLTGISSNANTGNVTFSNATVQGDNNSLNLSAGEDFTANSAYLQVRAGDVATHIHLDTGNNAFYDQYIGDDDKYLKLEAGDAGNIIIGTNNGNARAWTFGSDGNLILPSNTFAVKYANGTPVTFGAAALGNVTFDDQIVIGTGSNDGSGGLYLATGPTGAANLQYLQVRGGDNVAHIHLDTGNNAFYDQYFGNDNKFVKLEAGDVGNVVIGTDDANGNLYNWTFTSDGNLSIPSGFITNPTFFGVAITSNAVSSPGGIVFSVTGTDDVVRNLEFDQSGELTIPGDITSNTGNVTGGNINATVAMKLAVYANTTVRDTTITSPSTGMMIYVTGVGMQVRGATSWNTIAGSGT